MLAFRTSLCSSTNLFRDYEITSASDQKITLRVRLLHSLPAQSATIYDYTIEGQNHTLLKIWQRQKGAYFSSLYPLFPRELALLTTATLGPHGEEFRKGLDRAFDSLKQLAPGGQVPNLPTPPQVWTTTRGSFSKIL